MKWLKQFCKALAIWTVVFCSASVSVYFAWAAFGWAIDSSVIITIISSAFALLGAYQAKSAFEQHSRNKHGLDESGRPYKNKED